MEEQTKTVVLRMYEAFNNNDIAAMDTLFAKDFFSHPLNMRGTDGLRKVWKMLHSTYPDAQTVVDDILIDGDKAATRTSLQGVQVASGELFTGMEIIRVENGKIVEIWGLASGSMTA